MRPIAPLALLAVAGTVSAQTFFETGASGTFDTANWGVDRYAPGVWQPGAIAPNGDTALRVGVTNADRRNLRTTPFDAGFYDYQGRQRSSSMTGPWEYGGELFIPASWTTGNTLRESSLWARDAGATEAQASYPTFGFSRYDYNALTDPTAPSIVSRVWVFDYVNGDDEYYDLPVNIDGWNSFRVVDTGSQFDLFFNNTLVRSFTGPDYSLPGSEGLSRVFIQNYQFGRDGNSSTLPDSSYDAYWRNVYVAVPTPSAAALLGLGSLAALRRRR